MALQRYCLITSPGGVCTSVFYWENTSIYYPPSGYVVAGNNTGEVDWTYSSGTSAGGTWTPASPSYGLAVGDPPTPIAVADGGTGTTTSTGSGSVVLSQSPTLTGSPSIATGTITSSAPLTFTQTWNSAGTTFTGYQMNVTDTASAAASLLMDLQVGGTSRLNIDKNGNVTVLASANSAIGYSFGGTGATTRLWKIGSGGAIGWYNGSTTNVSFDTNGVTSTSFRIGATGNLDGTVLLTRKANANLQLGAADAAAPVAQSLSVQSVVAGTTNTAGVDLTINGSQGTGTGAGGSVIIRTAPAGTTGTAQNSLAERVRVGPAGQIGLGGANYGTSGQVLTSNGASAAPTWQNVSGGSLTLLGTVTASGTTLSLGSLTLTSYKMLYIVYQGVSQNGAGPRNVLIGNSVSDDVTATQNFTNAQYTFGSTTIDLTNGTAWSNTVSSASTSNTGANGLPYVADLPITTATTTLSFALSQTGDFNAGSILVYGVA